MSHPPTHPGPRLAAATGIDMQSFAPLPARGATSCPPDGSQRTAGAGTRLRSLPRGQSAPPRRQFWWTRTRSGPEGDCPLRPSGRPRTVISLDERSHAGDCSTHRPVSLTSPLRPQVCCPTRGVFSVLRCWCLAYLRRAYRAKAEVIARGADLAFAARADHVAGAILVGAEKRAAAMHALFLRRLGRVDRAMSGPCGLRATPPANFSRA